MAGHLMAEYLDSTSQYEVLGIARQSGKQVCKIMDVTDFTALRKYLDNIKPAYVVNCIGALVSQSRDDLSSAILLNSYLPHFLADMGEESNYKLIHISTDCVFSGKDGQYQENSFRDGDDNYARTKALGEINNKRDLTIRTSIIGPELKKSGAGLFNWFFNQHASINGYTQAYWSGVTTLELAKVTDEMIKQNISGLYHLCPAQKISKYDLLKMIAKVWNNNEIKILPYESYKVDKSLVCTRSDFIYPKPGYEKMLTELKSWVDKHPSYYMHDD